MRLIINQITVKHFDPLKGTASSVSGVFKAKIRTKRYLVNLALLANDLLASVSQEGKISSYFEGIGSAGLTGIRTLWDLNLIVGVPFSRWGARPFVTSPLSYPATPAVRDDTGLAGNGAAPIPSKHLIHQAQDWNRQPQGETGLTKAKLAVREGISRARVTQVMSLLRLPPEAQAYLVQLGDSKQVRCFSERRLRAVLSVKEPTAMARAWAEMVGAVRRAD